MTTKNRTHCDYSWCINEVDSTEFHELYPPMGWYRVVEPVENPPLNCVHFKAYDFCSYEHMMAFIKKLVHKSPYANIPHFVHVDDMETDSRELSQQ